MYEIYAKENMKARDDKPGFAFVIRLNLRGAEPMYVSKYLYNTEREALRAGSEYCNKKYPE